MTRSILDDVLQLEPINIGSLRKYFDDIALFIFSPLYSLPDGEQIIMFILCAYSEDSPMLVCNEDYEMEKNAICDKLNIPDYKRSQLIHLSDSIIRQCVIDYLRLFAGAEFQNLQFLKRKLADVEEILVRMLCRREVKGQEEVLTTEFDEGTHSRLIKESRGLAEDIERIEKSLKARKKYLFVEKFFDKKASSKKSETFNIEANKHIK